ncbi:MFS transporter [Sulfobacillus harzensis]|uniref:MFS transporter n=1 Tax=Sulfobacillus harzensis TaxID=2729629 RepID=A0A7Y0L726_9FIRM|nr:MFS transporter [Sulfobacillus harzensis]NMP24426.1 MFS transporter [Sulfobacillus harzensis]
MSTTKTRGKTPHRTRAPRRTVENAPMSPFHRRITTYSSGGPFLDGYILGIVGIAMTQMQPMLHLNSTWQGLIGGSALGGMFLGGAVFGYVTDLVGRRLMYTLDLWVIVIMSILQIFATNAPEIFVLRVIMGIAIGADYPIATSLLAEFAPKRHRGTMLGLQIVAWYVGGTVAYLVGYLLVGLGPGAWRWMLASSAVPAFALVILRHGTPESPRWLMAHHRVDEARAVMNQVFGPESELPPANEKPVSFGLVFQDGYLRRTLFVSLFWLFQIVPLFALGAFGPKILSSFGLASGNAANLGSAAINFVFLIGCLPALRLVETVGRRPLIIWSFVFMTVGLAIVSVIAHPPLWMVMFGFVVYALASGGPNVLDWIYPNELYPTRIRASAVGVATSASRIGAFVGTFVLPFSLAAIGIRDTMLIATVITIFGLFVSVLWAEETRGKTLAEASRPE